MTLFLPAVRGALLALSVSFLSVLMLFSLAIADEVRVGTWKTAQTIQPFLYERFLPQGTACQVFPFTNPADQKTALLAGSLDMCGTTIAHAIHSASQGQPVVVVAALCDKCSALVVKKDGPIQRVEDLKGKRIGYVPGTMHEILLRDLLAKHGLSPESDVVLTRVDFFDMGTALARDGIDAFLSGEPFPTLAVHHGYGRILVYPYIEEGIGTLNAGMLTTREMIEKRPDVVRTLVAAHAAATRHLDTHPEEWLEQAAAFGTDAAVLRTAAPNMQLTWRLDEAFVARAKALGQRMKSLGIIDREPDYAQLFDLSFSAAIAP